MIGKGVIREHFGPRTCSGKSQVKGNYKNIVLIDIDSDQVDDVVIIDLPEFLRQKLHDSSVPRRDRKCPRQSVISIDDDESDDADLPGIIAEGSGELDRDAASSKRFSPAPSCMQNSVHIDVDDCRVVYEKGSVSNMPKSRPTCTAKATDRNRYGLYGSESDSYESDCSDCELMEVREQWEKAFVKRKHCVFNDQSGYGEHATSSGFHSNIYTDFEVENRTEQFAGRTRSEDFPPRTKFQTYNVSSGVTGASSSKKEFCGKESKFVSWSQEERERKVGNIGSVIRNKDDNFSEVHSNCAPFNGRHVNCNGFVSQQSCDSQLNSGLGAEEKFRAVQEDSLLWNQEILGKSRVCNSLGVEETADSEVIPLSNLLFNDSQDKQNRSCLVENENLSDIDCPLRVQDCVSASDERDIINEREKLKETDEYKRAIEDEWASRQQQLQIQAEEAQRLRKRKRAESKRLLDMQRRQKERIEEVRETQKKDEEFMNLKEQLRVEIRKGLNKLEMQCIDMTSLLRGLGIQVGGGFNPLRSEVHAAYKRALFKFHPDRASKTDIREQVEAEEKFKLVSRMKEEFLLTSCY